MAKVIVLTSFSGRYGTFAASDEPVEIDLPADVVKSYVEAGFFEAVKAPAKRKPKSKAAKKAGA